MAADRHSETEAELIHAGARALASEDRRGQAGGEAWEVVAFAPSDPPAGKYFTARTQLTVLIAGAAALGIAVWAKGVTRQSDTRDLRTRLETSQAAATFQPEIEGQAIVERAPTLEERRAPLASSTRLQDELGDSRFAERLGAIEEGLKGTNAAQAQSAARHDKLEERIARLERMALDKTTTGTISKNEGAQIISALQKAESKNASTTNEMRTTESLPHLRDRFRLRGVEDGAAIIERRDGRLDEVEPGDTLPGAGRVISITRRGREWVVVTTKGIIDSR